MNVHRYDEEQRLQWVKQRRSGALSVKQVMEQAGISRATLYNWLAEFPEAEAITETAIEAAPVVVEIAAQRSGTARWQMLQDALAVVDEATSVRQAIVRQLVRKHTVSIAQACAIAGLSVEAFEHKVRKPEADDREVYETLCRLLEEDPSRQFEELIVLLRRIAPKWPRKQIRRIYKEGRLYQRRARKKATPVVRPAGRDGLLRRQRPDAVWTLGLAITASGTILYAADTVDQAGLGAIPILETDGAAGETTLIQFLTETAAQAGMPRKLRVPGIAPFTAREVLRWAMQQQVGLQTFTFGKEENAAEWNALSGTVVASIAASASLDAWASESLF
ncbi:MAG: AlpA family phage regulatory protein [Sphingobacteriales bacterium]|nr:MAG: AlpA family phage regulatory protein [Sphingobacteriales bacterium]